MGGRELAGIRFIEKHAVADAGFTRADSAVRLESLTRRLANASSSRIRGRAAFRCRATRKVPQIFRAAKRVFHHSDSGLGDFVAAGTDGIRPSPTL